MVSIVFYEEGIKLEFTIITGPKLTPSPVKEFGYNMYNTSELSFHFESR